LIVAAGQLSLIAGGVVVNGGGVMQVMP